MYLHVLRVNLSKATVRATPSYVPCPRICFNF